MPNDDSRKNCDIVSDPNIKGDTMKIFCLQECKRRTPTLQCPSLYLSLSPAMYPAKLESRDDVSPKKYFFLFRTRQNKVDNTKYRGYQQINMVNIDFN